MPDRLFEPETGEVSPGVACETRIEPLTDSEPETLASTISAWALEPPEGRGDGNCESHRLGCEW